MMQCYVLLLLMAKVTNLQPGIVKHDMTNAHIYDDQVDIFNAEHRHRMPTFGSNPKLVFKREFITFEDLVTNVTPDDFELLDYHPQEPIGYPMAA
jgi:thymidylate synthase